MKRPGYYVEGRYYGPLYAQAEGRARHLAATFGRTIKVMFLNELNQWREANAIYSSPACRDLCGRLDLE